jgi:hypothetical protein
MTKENIFKNFMEDPLLVEKNYISKGKIEGLRFVDQSSVKLIEVIKMAINSNVDGDSESVISRKINQYLNK